MLLLLSLHVFFLVLFVLFCNVHVMSNKKGEFSFFCGDVFNVSVTIHTIPNKRFQNFFNSVIEINKAKHKKYRPKKI